MQTIDFGDDKEAFWRAYQGKGKARKRKRTTTRAQRGEGSRQKDLATLARAGYTVTHQERGEFWLSNPASGAETPRCESYREALDLALELVSAPRKN